MDDGQQRVRAVRHTGGRGGAPPGSEKRRDCETGQVKRGRAVDTLWVGFGAEAEEVKKKQEKMFWMESAPKNLGHLIGRGQLYDRRWYTQIRVMVDRR